MNLLLYVLVRNAGGHPRLWRVPPLGGLAVRAGGGLVALWPVVLRYVFAHRRTLPSPCVAA